MSGHDAFERILTSLHEAMLDDVHWPTTTALIDEACGNCPTRGPRPRGTRPPRNAAATSRTIWGRAPYRFRYSSQMPLDRATAWHPPVYKPRHECVCR